MATLIDIVPAVGARPLYAIVDGVPVPLPGYVYVTYADGVQAIRQEAFVGRFES